MKFVPMAFIDWRLARGRMVRETAGRLPALFALALALLALVHSGGLDRYLSEQWVVTAVLKLHVPPAQGEGLAERLRGHEAVKRAEYRDSEAAWKETVAAYPGIEALRSEGGANPVPGYLEIRIRPDRLDPADVHSLESTLAAVPQVEKVILGSGSLSSLFRVRAVAALLFWSAFGVVSLLVFALVAVQEGARASDLLPEFRYLSQRGASGTLLAPARALAAAATGFVAAAASLLLAWPVLGRLAALKALAPALAPASEIPGSLLRLPVLLFPVAAAAAFAAASWLGWRGARFRRR